MGILALGIGGIFKNTTAAMSLYKRPRSNYWYCRFEIGGQKVRRSTGTDNKIDAAEFEASLRHQYWEAVKLGIKKHTFQEAALRWLEESSDKTSIKDDKTRMAWLLARLHNVLLSDIDGDVIASLRKEKRKESSPATANRHMALLRSMLNLAEHEWGGWLFKAPKVPMYQEPQSEPRWITPKEFNRLYKALPPYLASCAAFAVDTGLRSGPIRSMEWSQVDMRKKLIIIKKIQLKGGQRRKVKPLRVPLGPGAMNILRGCRGRHKRWVFTKDGIQVPREMVNRAWRRAVREAELEPLRFHDLRHTWASWKVMDGVPLHVLQALGGWASIEMTQRYGHLSNSEIDRWGRKPGRAKSVTHARKKSKKRT